MFRSIWEIIKALFSGNYEIIRNILSEQWMYSHLEYLMVILFISITLLLIRITYRITIDIKRINLESRRFHVDVMRSKKELNNNKHDQKE